MPEYDMSTYNWSPPTMEEFKELKRQEAEARKQAAKRTQKANLIAMLGTVAAGLGGRGGAQMAAGGAQQAIDTVNYENQLKMQDLQQEFINKIQLRELDMNERQFKMQMDREKHLLDQAIKIEDARATRARQQADYLAQGETGKLEGQLKNRQSVADFLKKIGIPAERIAEHIPMEGIKQIAGIPEMVAGKVEEEMPRFKAGREAEIAKTREEDVGLLEALPEEYGMMMEERGVMTPSQKEAKEREAQLFDLDLETAKINNKTASIKLLDAEGAPYSSVVFNYMVDNKGKMPPKPEQVDGNTWEMAKADARKEYQVYVGNDASIAATKRSNRGGDGTQPPPKTMNIVKNLTDFTKMTGAEQESYFAPVMMGIQYGNPDMIHSWIQEHVKAGADTNTIKMMLSKAFMDSGETLNQTMMKDYVYSNFVPTEIDEITGEEVPKMDYNSDEFKQFYPRQATQIGYTMKGSQWVKSGSEAEKYIADPAGYIMMPSVTGAGGGGKKDPWAGTEYEGMGNPFEALDEMRAEEEKLSKTPVGRVQLGEKKAAVEKRRALSSKEENRIIEKEAREAINYLDYYTLEEQFSTPLGLKVFKEMLVDEDGLPYSDPIKNKIVDYIKKAIKDYHRNQKRLEEGKSMMQDNSMWKMGQP